MEMILSRENLAYQWIVAEVFPKNEEFANPTCSSCITLVCVACVFDRHRLGKQKTCSTKRRSQKSSFDLIFRVIHAFRFPLTSYYVKGDNSITIGKHVLGHHRPISKKIVSVRNCSANVCATTVIQLLKL